MWNLMAGTALAGGYLLVFWIFGAALPARFRPCGIVRQCLTGFLLYFSLFELIGLPMKYFTQPLSHLTVAWGCAVLAVMVFVLVFRRHQLMSGLKRLPGSWKRNLTLILLVLFTAGIAVFLGMNTNTLSYYDSNNYIGLPVASLASDTLELVNPFGGKSLDHPQKFYLLNTDTLQSAVVCQALKIHPLTERKWSFTIAMVVLFEAALYQCGQRLFQKYYGKSLFFTVLANLVLFYSYSIAGVSQYISYRTYEGKAIICYLYTLMIFWYCTSIYRGETAAWPWAGLFLCGAGGIAFSNSALYIVPCMTGLTLLPWLLGELRKSCRWNSVRNYICVCIPSVFWILLKSFL